MDLPRSERLVILMLPYVLRRQHFTCLHEYKAVQNFGVDSVFYTLTYGHQPHRSPQHSADSNCLIIPSPLLSKVVDISFNFNSTDGMTVHHVASISHCDILRRMAIKGK